MKHHTCCACACARMCACGLVRKVQTYVKARKCIRVLSSSSPGKFSSASIVSYSNAEQQTTSKPDAHTQQSPDASCSMLAGTAQVRKCEKMQMRMWERACARRTLLAPIFRKLCARSEDMFVRGCSAEIGRRASANLKATCLQSHSNAMAFTWLPNRKAASHPSNHCC